jgi:hypothetical protein
MLTESVANPSAGNDSTSVGAFCARYSRFNARMRASLTSATLTSPAARGGATVASQRARPPSRTDRPAPSDTETCRRLLSGSTVGLVGLDDLLHELMPHDVAVVEVDE